VSFGQSTPIHFFVVVSTAAIVAVPLLLSWSRQDCSRFWDEKRASSRVQSTRVGCGLNFVSGKYHWHLRFLNIRLKLPMQGKSHRSVT
jgi:hypothetical protein